MQRNLALSLVPSHSPGTPRTDIKVPGDAGYAAMKLAVWSMRQAGFISEHDIVIGEKLAYILSGGRGVGSRLCRSSICWTWSGRRSCPCAGCRRRRNAFNTC